MYYCYIYSGPDESPEIVVFHNILICYLPPVAVMYLGDFVMFIMRNLRGYFFLDEGLYLFEEIIDFWWDVQ